VACRFAAAGQICALAGLLLVASSGGVRARCEDLVGGDGGPDRVVVEIRNVRDVIAVRDTKNRAGTVLTFPARAWRAFAADIKKR
jgi:hypothetical protein